MSDDNWTGAASDPSFSEYIVSELQNEFPNRSSVDLMIERAIRTVGR